jgi:tetratricopeptide (TPR) repeat protein
MALNDTSLFEVKKYAGIVSLRLGQYDKAINYFSQLANYTQLYANPGKFYHALTLMKRNRPGDKQTAKILLEQVVQNDLEEKETAQQWLKKW